MPTGIYKRTEWHKKRLSEGKRNYEYSHKEETKKKIGEKVGDLFRGTHRTAKFGKKHWNWKGGVTPEVVKKRNTKEYKHWRRLVIEKDRHACVNCGITGAGLVAHHVKSFEEYPELAFEVSNGQTLCYRCHTNLEIWPKRRLNKFLKETKEVK